MSNDNLKERIKEWLNKECLDPTGKTEEDMVDIPAKDILEIINDAATTGNVRDDYEWMNNDKRDPIDVACAKELGLEMDDEFNKTFREAVNEMTDAIMKHLIGGVVLSAAQNDPNRPLN